MQQKYIDLRTAWESGILFHYAAFAFATSRERDEFRNSRPHGIETRRLLMQANLFAEILVGRLLAIGIRTDPSANVDLEILPAILFEEEPGIVQNALCWPAGSVELGGRSWIHVRVLNAAQDDLKNAWAPVEVGADPLMIHGPATSTSRINISSKIGRPKTVDLVASIASEFSDAGLLKNISRKNQFHLVRERARERHPHFFPTPNQPSDDNMRKAFKLVGLILPTTPEKPEKV